MSKIEIKGIDVSTFQKEVDWEQVKADGVKFAILRAGFGDGNQDAMFESHMKGALDAGLDVGIYWFLYPTSAAEARQEARKCLELLEPYKGKINYPIYADYEYDSDRYAQEQGVAVTKAFRTDCITAFCDEVEKAGWYAGWYANLDYIRNKVDMTRLSRYDLWLADYTGGPNYDCGMQQFTSSGKVDGITGGVDCNTAFYDYPTRIREKGCNHLGGDKPTTGKPSTAKTGTCTGDGVRIRAEAHTAAKVLGSADKGDRLELLADDGWGWSKVKANGVTGWMYNSYINGSGRSKPKTVYCSGSYVNLRQNPSTSAKVVRQLQPGDTVTLVSINPDGWLDVDGGYLYYDKSYLSIR